MHLSSPAFGQGEPIPRQHTRDGPELSPPLQWTDPPEGTARLALVVEDPDAPGGLFTHWLLWNLPPGLRRLPQDVRRARNLPDGSKQGRNDYGGLGWGGPAPPPGEPHRYVLTLLALDGPLPVAGGVGRAELLAALEGRVLGRASLTGLYGRGRTLS